MTTPNTPITSATVPQFSREVGLPAGILRRFIAEGRIPGIYSGSPQRRGKFYINVPAAKAALASMIGTSQP